ncbi:hypothetical protein NPIL_518811, partial [Nephila pilipes]
GKKETVELACLWSTFAVAGANVEQTFVAQHWKNVVGIQQREVLLHGVHDGKERRIKIEAFYVGIVYQQSL